MSARDSTPRPKIGRTLAILRRRHHELRLAWVDDDRGGYLSAWRWNFDPMTGRPYPDKTAGVRFYGDDGDLDVLAEAVEEARRCGPTDCRRRPR